MSGPRRWPPHIRIDPPGKDDSRRVPGVCETRPCMYNIIISITQKKIATSPNDKKTTTIRVCVLYSSYYVQLLLRVERYTRRIRRRSNEGNFFFYYSPEKPEMRRREKESQRDKEDRPTRRSDKIKYIIVCLSCIDFYKNKLLHF